MDIETDEQRESRLNEAIEILTPRGYSHWFGFFFVKDGKTYDFSAADLNQLDRIEREGLFVVEYDLQLCGV